MVDTLLDHFEPFLQEIVLKPSDGGRFEVTIDGDLIFSRLDVGRFPGQEEITRLVSEKLGLG